MNKGKVVFLDHESEVLKSNPLGDPYQRKVPVYLPPDYESSGRDYPVIFGLIGYTGAGDMYLQRRYPVQSFDQIFDELISSGQSDPFIYVMPDCLSKYGGSQYVNSPAVGQYEDYLVKELVPLIDSEFRTSGGRAAIGGSSGGIGSFTLCAKYPEIFQAMGDHCGDSAFLHCYLSDIPKVVIGMEKYDYDPKNFIKAIFDTSVQQNAEFKAILGMLAMSACYCPNENEPLGFEFPFDLYTGKVKEAAWEKMKTHDPVEMVPQYVDNLKKLKLIFIDCGRQDQFNLYLGSRQLVDNLKKNGIDHIYDEYDSDHGMLRRAQKKKSIPLIVKAISS